MSYFIVVHKNVTNSKSLGFKSNYAVFMWRGEDGLNVTKNAIGKFINTSFKEMKIKTDKNSGRINQKKGSMLVNKPSSLLKKRVTVFGKAAKLESFGIEAEEETSNVLGIKKILTPLRNFSDKGGDSDDIDNILPLVDNENSVVSLRSMVTADNEPHAFTTLFSGSMVIRSYDFIKYGTDNEFGNVMLYQLIGVPYINQKAVEVPVEWASLSTTGLYIMFADDHIFYWIGKDYFAKYTTTKYLMSDEMMRKLNYIYEEEASELISDEKNIHYILQGLETELFTQILTKEGEIDIEMPDYESKLITQNVILPTLPR